MMGVDPHELNEMMHAVFPVEAFPEHIQGKVRIIRVKAARRRVLNRIANGAYYGALIVVAGWLLAQAFDRSPPVETTMDLLTPKVAPGDDLKFTLHAKRHRACWTTVSWLMWDGHHEVRPFSDDPIPPQPSVPAPEPIRSFPVWRDAAPGAGKIRVTRSYICPGNYLHQFNPIVVTSPDYAFEIVPRGEE